MPRDIAPHRVSVVSVNYKIAGLVGKMIESVPAAAGPNSWEIIVVDNASNDGSVERLRASYPHVDVVANDVNVGFARGNNTGAERAHGDYLALVNPDVVLGPGSLAALIDFLEAHPRAGLVGPKIVLPSGETQSVAEPLPSSWDVLRALPGGQRLYGATRRFTASRNQGGDSPERCGVIHGSCMVLRRSAWDAIGGMPVDTFMYGEEALLGHRLRLAGWEVWYDPEASVHHESEASASQHFEPHDRALKKRWGHTVARAKILPRPAFLAWNAIFALRALGQTARASLDPERRRHAMDFLRLHSAALTATPGTPPPSPWKRDP